MTILVLTVLAMLGGQSTMGAMPMAGDHPAPCTAPAPLPADLAAFTANVPLTAAATADAAPVMPLGRGATVTLGDAAAVHWSVAPDHAPAAGSYGGMLALVVPTAGRYRVALGAGAWVDLIGGGASLRSAAHGHGPACTAVKKLVAFDLQPGRYLLQLSGNAAPTLGVMVARAVS